MEHTLIIQHINKHIQLTSDQEARVLDSVTSKNFNKKEILLREGSSVHHDYFVLRGCLRTYVVDDNGTEHNIMFATENWWTGDFKGLYKQTPATHNIQALEPTEVLCLSKQNKEALFEEIPQLLLYFNKLFENAIIAQQTRIEEILCLNADQRYLNFLSLYPTLSQRISQKHIASFLGITPEFLSMIRRKLVEK